MERSSEIVAREREEREREAERREIGRRASAITRRTGAEKRRKETIIVIKKKTVLTPLKTLFDFSSFGDPIVSMYRELGCCLAGEEEGFWDDDETVDF